MKNQKAFTLLEMLLVIAIIAILAGIVIVAINPGRQLAQSRNTKRWNDIRSLYSAVQQYYIDNKEWPLALQSTEIDGNILDICREGQSDPSCIDLEADLVPTYLSAIPEDPQASTTSTLYRIGINPNSKIPDVVAINSTEYDLEEVKIITPCGDPTNVACWSDENPYGLIWGPNPLLTNINSNTDGKANTNALVARSENFPAAQYCFDLVSNGYVDWYLPAPIQLQTALNKYQTEFENGNTVWGDFKDNTAYWSSAEYSNSNGLLVGYAYGFGVLIEDYTKSSDVEDVRCFR